MQKVRPVPTDLSFSHRRSCTEKTLKALLRQQRTKIEEIKKNTNYYTTRNLLERYDEPPSGVGGGGAAASDPNSALRRRMPGGPPMTPQRPGQPSNLNTQTPVSKVQTHQQQLPISSTLQNQLAGMMEPNHIVTFLPYQVIFFPYRYTPAHPAPSKTMV